MKNWVHIKLLDLKARQEAGEVMPCPRCGRMTMKPDVHRNALSRLADIYVCDECGIREALRAVMKNPLIPADWECMKVQHPFEADNVISYLPTIDKHIPILKQVYCEWLQDGCPSDFRQYRNCAQHECPGVTNLWTEPFQIEYRAKDGTRALIRFRQKDDEIQYAIDTFKD